MVDNFNLYYIKSIEDIIDSIDIGNNSIINDIVVKCNKERKDRKVIWSNFEMIDANEMEEIIGHLPNKKGTLDGINSELIKTCVYVIKKELVNIINESMCVGICPESWKTSTIVPISKTKKPKKADEFRPINILPIYEKILEIAIKNQL